MDTQEKIKISPTYFADKTEEYTRKSILRVLEEKSYETFQSKLKEELIKKLGSGMSSSEIASS